MKKNTTDLSEEANKIARANQKPGQTKQQTKLIALGIQKGIEQYKKQHKAKLRQQDKLKKKGQKKQEIVKSEEIVVKKESKLAWGLLFITWAGICVFILQILLTR